MSSDSFAGRRSWPLVFAAVLISALALPLSAADVPLSFNLDRTEDRSGDFPLVFYTFRCGSKLYTFCPPAAWTINGEATGMSFTVSTREGDAVARFRASSPAELALLSRDQDGRREPALRKNLPGGSCEVRQGGPENTNALPVFGYKSVEIVYNFECYGHALKASVVVCQLDDKNGFTLVMTVPSGTGDDFISQVRRTLGAAGVVEDKSLGNRR